MTSQNSCEFITSVGFGLFVVLLITINGVTAYAAEPPSDDDCWRIAVATENGKYKTSPEEFSKLACKPEIIKNARSNDFAAAKKPPSLTPEDPSVLKKYMWRNSFDAAADASFSAAEATNKCAGSNALCAQATKTAQDISSQQRTFADVSRVSDAVGMASTAGAITAEMAIKDNSQSASLGKVAKIQKIAGKANIAAGATDIGLAAIAYAHQMETLDEQAKEFNKKLKTENLSEAQVKALAAQYKVAVEKTKEASMKHAGWGVAKVGAGAISLAAAKSAEANQKTLEDAQANAIPSYIPVQPIGYVPQYPNSSPSFVVPTSSGNSVLNSTPSGAVSSTGGSIASPQRSNGSNLIPSNGGSTSPASRGVSTGGSLGASTASAATKKTERDPAAVGPQPAEPAEVDYGSGGGGLGYKGGSGGDSDNGLSSIVSSLLGGGGPAANNSTAPAAQAAVSQTGGPEAGPEPGISPENVSLFDQVHAQHERMLASGNLIGRTK